MQEGIAEPLYKGTPKSKMTPSFRVKMISTKENNLQKQLTSLQKPSFMSQAWPV